MRKWFIWLIVVALLFAICGCDKEVDEVLAETETVCPTAEATEPTTPVYDSIEYWEIVHDEMVSMLNEHNLYVAAINSNYPCVLYEVEPGIVQDFLDEVNKILEPIKAECSGFGGECGWYQPQVPFAEANWDWDDEKGFVIGGTCL